MKKLLKSVIAALLSAISLAFVFSSAACSFGRKDYVATDDGYFEFVLNEEGTEYSVKAASVDNLPNDVYLPAEHDGKPVSAVADNGFENAAIQAVWVPLSIKKIGEKAFANCSNLKSSYFYKGQGLEEIGDGAFYGDALLGELVCPNTLKKVGNSAFWGCVSLERVKLPEKVETIGNYAFAYCTGLTYFYIPTKTSAIGDGAFKGAENVTFELSSSNVYFTLIDGKPVRIA